MTPIIIGFVPIAVSIVVTLIKKLPSQEVLDLNLNSRFVLALVSFTVACFHVYSTGDASQLSAAAQTVSETFMLVMASHGYYNATTGK